MLYIYMFSPLLLRYIRPSLKYFCLLEQPDTTFVDVILGNSDANEYVDGATNKKNEKYHDHV